MRALFHGRPHPFKFTKIIDLMFFKRKRTAVLGAEMANACSIVQKRIEEGNYGPSPMPEVSYDSFPNERHLFNPIRNSLDDKLISLVSVAELSTRRA
jgi:hypothetical protein